MDKSRAIELSNRRIEELESEDQPVCLTNGYLGEAPLSLAERYASILNRVEKLVDHDAPFDPDYPQRVSKAVHICRTGGPLPNISLRFRYHFERPSLIEPISLTNEHGELIQRVTAEWIHTPDGEHQDDEPPETVANQLEALEFGEVYAEESVIDPIHPIHTVSSTESYYMVEQSLDAYEKAIAQA